MHTSSGSHSRTNLCVLGRESRLEDRRKRGCVVWCVLVWGSWKASQGGVKKQNNLWSGENRVFVAKALVDGAQNLPERKADVGRVQCPGKKLGPWELFEICHLFILGKRGTSKV